MTTCPGGAVCGCLRATLTRDLGEAAGELAKLRAAVADHIATSRGQPTEADMALWAHVDPEWYYVVRGRYRQHTTTRTERP